MIDTLPSVLAPKGHRARAVLASAFQEYFEQYEVRETRSSAMIRARYTANTKHGVSFQDQGRLEVGTLLGILANTIPSAFYMIPRIYSDAKRLNGIRRELEATYVTKDATANS